MSAATTLTAAQGTGLPRTRSPLIVVSLLGLVVASGCATSRGIVRRPAPAPEPGRVEEGLASWYGEPYHGRATASGARYDMWQMTAAHRTLPFGTRVRVTNLESGATTEVVITDRGPFVEGRILDLSRAAAERLGAVGPGVIRVRLEVIETGDGMVDTPCWEVQVGAFSRRANAERAGARLEKLGYHVALAPAGGGLTRVRAVELGGREAALRAAAALDAEFPGATPLPCGGGW